MLVSVWFTVTLALLVVDSPPASVIVTRKLYVPAFVNRAVVNFAALLLLAEKFTAAGGVPVVDQAYVRFDSPASSAPNTESAVDVPVTGLGVAAAAVATVGAASVTVATAVPLADPLVAVTVTEAEPYGAVNSPLPSIEPAVADQVVPPNPIAAPNWSLPLAVNCCVA
jgi:hypothetical protein